MSGPVPKILAPCSGPSRPRSAPRAAVALWPAWTALARAAFLEGGRDGETPFNRTKKPPDGVVKALPR